MTTGSWLGSAGLACATHPYHVSSAEVRWNPESGNFEVALCVWPADLELAIAKHSSQPADLSRMDGLNAALETYVSERFFIRRAPPAQDSEADLQVKTLTTDVAEVEEQEEIQKIRWVGSEIDLKKAWLYFEVPGSRSGASWQIENRVFYELNVEQLNQIQLTVNDQVVSIALHQKLPVHRFTTNR